MTLPEPPFQHRPHADSPRSNVDPDSPDRNGVHLANTLREPGVLSRRAALQRAAGLGLAAAALSAGIIATGPGCAVSRRIARNRYRFVIPIQGEPIMLGQLAALDLENHLGSVRVIGDPDQLQAEVEVRTRRPEGVSREAIEAINAKNWIATQTVNDDGRRVLRVLIRGVEGMEESVESDVIVRMPSVDGLVIRNAGGQVIVENVAGGIHIENGRGSLPGGRIILKTERPLIDPVTLLTTTDPIILACPPESRGVIELKADQGRVVMNAPDARLTQATPAVHSWSGVLNSGTNTMTLRSLGSDVRMHVVDRPFGIDTSRIY